MVYLVGEPSQQASVSKSANFTAPWKRFVARLVDLGMVILLSGLLLFAAFILVDALEKTFNKPLTLNIWFLTLFMVVSPLTSHFIHSSYITKYKTSFGKWLFSTRIEPTLNSDIKLSSIFLRELYINFMCIFSLVPFIGLVFLGSAYLQAKSYSGLTYYDKLSNVQLVSNPTNPVRVITAFILSSATILMLFLWWFSFVYKPL